MLFLNFLTRKKKLGFISLALLAILLVSGALASSIATPRSANNLSSTSGLARPVHTSHVMEPVSTSLNAGSSLAANGICPEPSAQCFASYNWGGYAVTGAIGSVTEVKGSWVVPAITGQYYSTFSCQDNEKTWYDASVWIGIDGFTSQTVEQTGTGTDCYYGQAYYYAWFEFYPAPSYTVFNVNPGDSMTAEVTYSPTTETFTTTITDLTTHQTNTTSTSVSSVPGAEENSAEWIDESAFGFLGELALTQVTPVQFTSTSATVSGVSHTLSGWGTSVNWILEVDYNFGVNQETGVLTPNTETLAYAKADPSAVQTQYNQYNQGSGFSVYWLSAGP